MRPTTPKTRAEFVAGTTLIVGREILPISQHDDVEPLDDTYVEEELASIADEYGAAEPTIYIWDMDVANGFVLGTPEKTIIVVSTALIDLLNQDEVVAVLAHELGHTAQQHTLKLSGLLIAAISAGLVAARLADQHRCKKTALAVLLGVYGIEAVGILAATRRAEAAADAIAMEAVDPAVLDSALQKIIRAGRDEYPERSVVDQVIATHPPYRQRADKND